MSSTRSSTGAGLTDPASPKEQRDRYRELLEELRTLIPGAQVLLAFLFTVPFTSEFGRLDDLGRDFFAGVLASTALAVILFMTPAAFHRLAPHLDRSARLQFAIRVTVVGLALLSASVAGAMFVVIRFVFDSTVTGVVFGAATTLVALTVWLLLPGIHREAGDGTGADGT